MLVRYLRDHNVKVTEHITRNLLLATIVMGTSVFSYGFETSVINTTQAMGGEQAFRCPTPFSADPCPR